MVGVTMSVHKLTAGSGYDYLARQVAALDATEKGSHWARRRTTPTGVSHGDAPATLGYTLDSPKVLVGDIAGVAGR